MGEFELIRRYLEPVANRQRHPGLILATGDDCAVQQLPADQELVFSIDTLVESVHFPRRYRADYLAWRSLAAAASDLAAMGADPVCFTLALTLPEADSAWLRAFAEGLGEAAQRFGLALAGGDTTRGPLALSVQVHGSVPRGAAILRSGARPGDLIAVSGTLGDAAAALACLDSAEPSGDEEALLARYHRPEPRLALGRALRGFASAAIDISDGLGADLGHLLEASGVGATLDLARLPLSLPLRRCRPEEAQQLAWSGGDDYELLVTIPELRWQELSEAVRARLTVIGQVQAGTGVRFRGASPEPGAGAGFDHFRRERT